MIVKNISKYLKNKGVRVSAAEREIGVSNGTLSKPIKDNKTIKTDTLEKFLNKYNDINTYWLFTGQGEMLLNQTGGTNNYESNNTTDGQGGKHPLSPLEEINTKINADKANPVNGDIALKPIDTSLGIDDPESMDDLAFYKKMYLFYVESVEDYENLNFKLRKQLDLSSDEIVKLHILIKSLQVKLRKYEKGKSIG